MTTAGLPGGELCCTDTTAIMIEISSLSFSLLNHDVSVRVHDLKVASGWLLLKASQMCLKAF